MKYLLILSRTALSLALFFPHILFAEELIENGSMETSRPWKGDGKIEKLKDESYMVLEADDREPATLIQKMNTRNAKDGRVSFKYRSSDYKGGGLQVSYGSYETSAGGFTLRIDDRIKVDGEWHTYELEIASFEDRKDTYIIFRLLEGTGTFHLDDISVKPFEAK